MAVASRQTRQAGSEIQDVLEERDVRGLGLVALSSAGGVVVAQEVADRILPLLNMPRNPTTATEFAASGGVKTGVALGFGALAARLSGVGTLVAAFMGVGSLAGAGADFLNAIQRTGLAAEAPFQGQPGGMGASGGGNNSANRASQSSEVTV